MIGFVAGDPRPSEGFSWIATIGVAPESSAAGDRARSAAGLRGAAEDATAASLRAGFERGGHPTSTRPKDTSRVEVWQSYYRDGEAAIVMEKIRDVMMTRHV